MAQQRLSSADRRSSIISAARTIFARYGLEGARTQQIARAAEVSEALLFRHFASKAHLYRAVLRNLIVEQNATFRSIGPVGPGVEGLLEMVRRAVAHAMLGAQANNAEGMRMVLGSLAADGDYARIVYRRALRLARPSLEAAMAQAQAQGALIGTPISTSNAVAFIEHVGSMMLLARVHHRPAVAYDGDDTQQSHEAIAFCARGLGIDPARVDAYLKQISA